MKNYHLAQVNIADAHAALDTVEMKGFNDRLDEINTVADNSPGFIWRWDPDDEDTSVIDVFDDPLLLVNISVWQNLDSLKAFVYQTSHSELLSTKASWFYKMSRVNLALWWIPPGHQPTVKEAAERLEHFQENGATSIAFNFAKSFEADA